MACGSVVVIPPSDNNGPITARCGANGPADHFGAATAAAVDAAGTATAALPAATAAGENLGTATAAAADPDPDPAKTETAGTAAGPPDPPAMPLVTGDITTAGAVAAGRPPRRVRRPQVRGPNPSERRPARRRVTSGGHTPGAPWCLGRRGAGTDRRLGVAASPLDGCSIGWRRCRDRADDR